MKLESNKTIYENFTESEVQDLQVIFDFFNSQICDSKQFDNEALSSCYNEYCSRIRTEQKKEQGFVPQIDFDAQLLMYEQINEGMFNEIWEFHMQRKNIESDALKYLSLNHNGKYKFFLKAFATENKAVYNYYDSFDASGDMSPLMFANLIMDYESYNIEDIRTKLFIAIHYLTLNDQFNRNEKY